MIEEKIIKESDELKIKFRSQIASYLTAAFGVVAGLAWNDAVKSLIEYLFPMGKDTVQAKFIYAVIITAVLVAVSIFIARLFKTEEMKK